MAAAALVDDAAFPVFTDPKIELTFIVFSHRWTSVQRKRLSARAHCSLLRRL